MVGWYVDWWGGLSLDSVDALGEVLLALGDTVDDHVLLGGREGTADGTGLLLAEVVGALGVVRVVLAVVRGNSLLLLLAEDSHDARNRLAHSLELGKLGGGSTLLAHTQLRELGTEVVQSLQERVLVV